MTTTELSLIDQRLREDRKCAERRVPLPSAAELAEPLQAGLIDLWLWFEDRAECLEAGREEGDPFFVEQSDALVRVAGEVGERLRATVSNLVLDANQAGVARRDGRHRPHDHRHTTP